MKYSDQQRIEKMRETTEKLLRYVEKENITPERIFAEETVQWTVTTPLYNIGEHAANLSEDFKKQYPDIPWVKIAGLRHRLVHHYEDTRPMMCYAPMHPNFKPVGKLWSSVRIKQYFFMSLRIISMQ